MDLTWLQPFGYGAVVLALVTALVGVLRYQNKQITDGKLIPATTHERELLAAVERGNEWKATAVKANDATETEKTAHAVTRGQLSQALEANEIVKHFFSAYLPSRATRDDNDHQTSEVMS